MIRFFRRSKAFDDFVEGIRPELKAIPMPAPSDALKERIMTSRAAGVRNILPAPEIDRLPASWVAALALAAAVVLLLIPIQRHRTASGGGDFTSPGFFGQIAFAQTPHRGDRPRLEAVRATGSTKLRPLSLEMERRVVDSAGRVAVGHISLRMSAASLSDVAAWRVISIDRDPLPSPHVAVETVYVSKADLRLLRRSVHVSPYRRWQRINVVQQFNGDSVSGRMTTDGPSIGAGRSFARELPRAFAPFTTASIEPVFLMAVPVNREWRGSASLLGWAVRDNDVLLPTELRVEGEETITVPAGRFDCWRLSVRFAGRQIDYWVRKSDGLGVRVLDKSDAAVKRTREIVLRRVE